MSKEAMTLALEALKAHADIGIKSDKAIEALEEALASEQEQGEPTNAYDDPCPDCGKQLQVARGGGVKCTCGYWFCF